MRAVIPTLLLAAACGPAYPICDHGYTAMPRTSNPDDGYVCRTHDDVCCHCLVEIDCITGRPADGQCVEHIDDVDWRRVAIIPNTCMTDNDACGAWCRR